ncbi:MAG: glycoside hydrolase [Bryobacterales bacterium]|nr:glycoside hydrolase [Bryobacterales bacterium]
MAQIYLCFVWHMHQPFYKDLVTGQYHLPWTRMHALKDYYGMVKVLDAFPRVHQTFNLVPSMMVQIAEYVEGKADDPFLHLALKPAEDLNEQEQAFILRYFFQAHPGRLIRRYPRYGELLDLWEAAGREPRRARASFGPAAMRDLQVLSQVAWFDEDFLAHDAEVRDLVAKERNYSLDDQKRMGRLQVKIMSEVLPVYREFSRRGQIEVSTTPFYHPILPLLCDSNIAGVSHPYVPLPTRFRYPEDARHQLERSREYMTREFGAAPVGLWPSEGSVSDEAFSIASQCGFQWAATDNGVLARTLERHAGPYETYRPYEWSQGGQSMKLLFRDHELSDLIGFVYSRMDAHSAADHFLRRVREHCWPILSTGRDALVPVILDGENAWEHYDLNGRPFLETLYGRIAGDGQMEALTVSEAMARVPAEPLSRIFPGSWINANFDVWIGAEEDNRAWELLLRARQAYEAAVAAGTVGEPQRKLAWEELLIAEGSDWCWWYGPEHSSDNRAEFDQLFRSHLTNVFRLVNAPAPEELARPILKVPVSEQHHLPSAPIQPQIDGQVTSYFEWLGAGSYRVDNRSGAMHGKRFLVRELLYGSDRNHLFLRVDFEQSVAGIRLHLNAGGAEWDVELEAGVARVRQQHENGRLEAAYHRVLELRIPLSMVSQPATDFVPLQLSLWQDALPLDALPHEGWIRLSTAEPSEWGL